MGDLRVMWLCGKIQKALVFSVTHTSHFLFSGVAFASNVAFAAISRCKERLGGLLKSYSRKKA
jgi:hypothetical protein